LVFGESSWEEGNSGLVIAESSWVVGEPSWEAGDSKFETKRRVKVIWKVSSNHKKAMNELKRFLPRPPVPTMFWYFFHFWLWFPFNEKW
jgi:hypothetical protein